MKEEALAKISLNEIGFIFSKVTFLSDSCCIGSRENRKSSFMEDGEVVSEIQLGKFRNDDLKAREEIVKMVSYTRFKDKNSIEYRSFSLLKVRKDI